MIRHVINTADREGRGIIWTCGMFNHGTSSIYIFNFNIMYYTIQRENKET